jgi:2-keto-4-pentenoate hydratase
MTPDQQIAWTNALLAARGSGAPLARRDDADAITLADAYAIQDRVAAHFGGPIGWKVGAPRPDATPSCAPILPGCVWIAPDAAIKVPDPVGFEVEIAFRLGRAFSAAAAAPSCEEVLEAVVAAHVAIELCASRLADGPRSPPLANLADNGMNVGFVLGPEVAGWREIAAARQRAEALLDGHVHAQTVGGHTHGDIVELLIWLVAHAVTQRGGLPANAVVAAGAWTGLHWISAPARVGARFEGLGAFACDLVRS